MKRPKTKKAGRSPHQLRAISCLVARWTGLHVAPGVNRRVVHSNFVVHVGPGGAPANARVADDLTAFNSRADHRRKRGKVRVPRCNAKPMIDDYQSAVTCVILSYGDYAIRRRMNRRAVIRCYVHARVERAFTAERVEALAKTIGDMPHHRPNGGRVAGVGEF